MPLSGTGPISMSQIKAELGSASNSLRAYSDAAGKSAPDIMSEFFGYGTPSVTPAVPSPTPAPVYQIELSYGATSCEAKQNYPQE
jgi:hypothetical protein